MRLLTGILLTAIALAIEPPDLAAQSVLCQTIRPGETAASVARRLTGDANSRIQSWFSIVDRQRRVVPKSDYGSVVAGWHVCVPATRLRAEDDSIARSPIAPARAPGTAAPRPVAAPPPVAVAQPAMVPLPVTAAQPVAAPPAATVAQPAAAAPRTARGQATLAAFTSRRSMTDLALIGLGAILIGVGVGLAWQCVEQAIRKREAVAREMHGFAEVFVKDFERPLRIEGMTSPIRARLRCAAGKRRLEILVAPAPGRRYPNLDDHRLNVEYDVDRVTKRLSRTAFVRRPLHAEGAWVVIPFHFEPSPRTGAVV